MAIFDTTTALPPEDVIGLAKTFFATRVPATACFVEQASARHVVLRGQGGEEIVIAATPGEGGTAVRGSSLMFAQQVQRFFTTLPRSSAQGAA
jgi:hypothetical protein